MSKAVPIVVCTVHEKCIPVMKASIETYAPGVDFLLFKGTTTTFGEAYNAALTKVFETYDEVIIANDDIVLTPTSYKKLLADVEILKAKHGAKLGIVGAHTDSAFPSQNIRYPQGEQYTLDRGFCKWSWENEIREEVMIAPIFAWISKHAFETAQFPPLNWFSDNLICADLYAAGFKNFVSTSYVHHVGSQTVGQNFQQLNEEASVWLHANRPDLAQKWFGNPAPPPPKKLKICVYAISKNEEQFVERFCESAKDADLILIADTGSTDATIHRAFKHGAIVYPITINPWRFDHARNAALALIPSNIDVCVSLDLDEVLEPGWREEIEKVWTSETTRLKYMYEWGKGLRFLYEKIHARIGYHWHHPCHEYPRPDQRKPEVWAHTNKLLVTHHPDPDKSRGQYLDLLALSVKEDPSCPRNAFYYARELSFYARWDEAIEELQRYLALPSATWGTERAYAMRTLGKCFEAKGDIQAAEHWRLRSTCEASLDREPWFELSSFYYRQARWMECYHSALRTLSITNKVYNYTNDPEAWGALPFDYAAIAAWRLGLKEDAIKYGQQALDLAPTDARLIDNLKWYKGEKDEN